MCYSSILYLKFYSTFSHAQKLDAPSQPQSPTKLQQIPPRKPTPAHFNQFAEWTAPEVLLAKRKGSNGAQKINGQSAISAQPNVQTDMWGLGLITFCL